MKKIFVAMCVVVLSAIFTTNNAIAQAHIVHYDTSGKIDSKRPDFKNTVVAIDFGGTAAVNAKTLFMKLGVKDFSEGNKPCVIDQTVICMSINVGAPMNVSSYGGGSGYTNNGGSYNQSSFSGKLYPINVTVELIERHKDGSTNVVPLGSASCLAPAGSSSEWISNSGRRGGGSFNASATSGLDSTMGLAVNKDITHLLDPSLMRRLFATGTYAKWLPGADTSVKAAFAE